MSTSDSGEGRTIELLVDNAIGIDGSIDVTAIGTDGRVLIEDTYSLSSEKHGVKRVAGVKAELAKVHVRTTALGDGTIDYSENATPIDCSGPDLHIVLTEDTYESRYSC